MLSYRQQPVSVFKIWFGFLFGVFYFVLDYNIITAFFFFPLTSSQPPSTHLFSSNSGPLFSLLLCAYVHAYPYVFLITTCSVQTMSLAWIFLNLTIWHWTTKWRALPWGGRTTSPAPYIPCFSVVLCKGTCVLWHPFRGFMQSFPIKERHLLVIN